MLAEPRSQNAPTKPGLGVRSARGFAYLASGALFTKLLSFGVQIALSYLLSKKDFGVVGLAFTFTVVIQIIEHTGVTELLVQRRRFRLWAIPGFWYSLTLGIVSCSLILLSAPVASTLYRDRQLFWVLLVMAPSSLFNSLMAIPRAQLARELRFRALAAVNFANVALRLSLTLLLAALDFGPFSFVVPVPIASAAVAAFLWWWVRPPFANRLNFRRWRYLVGDSWQLLSAGFALAVLDQSDYMMIGLFRTVEEVGIYWFGFNFSIQVLQLLSINVTNMLFPALTTLNDRPQQQFQAFLKAQRILTMVGISGCLLQAAASRPLTLLVLPPKWEPSIIVMQILSIGMATRMVAGSSYALLKSQGRFRAISRSRWAFVALQLIALAAVLGLGGGLAEVAVVVAIIATLIGLITLRMAITPYDVGWKVVAEVLVRPVLCGLVAVGTAWAIAAGMAAAGYGNLAQLVETLLVAVALNALLARTWLRPVWNDLWARLWQLAPAGVGRRQRPDDPNVGVAEEPLSQPPDALV